MSCLVIFPCYRQRTPGANQRLHPASSPAPGVDMMIAPRGCEEILLRR